MQQTYILSTLKKYTEVTEIVDDNFENLQSKLNQFSTVIIGYHKSDIAWRTLILAKQNYKISIFS
jgi:hypothetical protein